METSQKQKGGVAHTANAKANLHIRPVEGQVDKQSVDEDGKGNVDVVSLHGSEKNIDGVSARGAKGGDELLIDLGGIACIVRRPDAEIFVPFGDAVLRIDDAALAVENDVLAPDVQALRGTIKQVVGRGGGVVANSQLPDVCKVLRQLFVCG